MCFHAAAACVSMGGRVAAALYGRERGVIGGTECSAAEWRCVFCGVYILTKLKNIDKMRNLCYAKREHNTKDACAHAFGWGGVPQQNRERAVPYDR